jgi:hypothetical protein
MAAGPHIVGKVTMVDPYTNIFENGTFHQDFEFFAGIVIALLVCTGSVLTRNQLFFL